MKATLWGHAEVVELLLGRGADVTVEDAEGWTALKIAIEKDHSAIAGLIRAAGPKP
jgi:ankyrin repeat protein